MAKAKQKHELTADASFEAFERLLTIQSESLQELAAAQGNTVATQVAKVKAINSLREAFDEAAIPAVMKIAGTAIGFRTDKDTDAGTTAYSTEIIREVCIEAMLSGLELLGNQFNIIAGRMYTTLEGYQHKLASLDYVTDLDIAVGNPEDVEVQEQEKDGRNGRYTVFTVYGFVPVVATCRIYGVEYTQANVKADNIDGRFQVSASGKDKLATVDSLKSKAEKRARERLFDYAATATASGDVIEYTVEGTTTAKELERLEHAAEPAEGIAERTPETWKTLFVANGVLEQAGMLRDAPDEAARNQVLQAAGDQQLAGKISQTGYSLLVEYAKTKA